MLPQIATIVTLGVLTSYEDLRRGRIPNTYVAAGMLLAAFLNGPSYPVFFAYHAVVALLFVFVIWLAGLWTAGDAKLFLAFSMLVPVSAYSQGFLPYFPSFTIFINTFIPVAVLLGFLVILKTNLKDKLIVMKKVLRPTLVANVFMFVIGFGWLIRTTSSYLALPQNYFLNVIILFLLYEMLSKVLPFRKILFAVTGIALVLGYEAILTLEFLQSMLYLFVLFLLLRYFVLYLGFYAFSRSTPVKELKPGMVLSEGITRETDREGKHLKSEIVLPTVFSILRHAKMQFLYGKESRGLSEEEVREIKEMHKKKKFRFDEIRVHETVPFAPFLFAGALVTMALQGTFFILLDSIS
jgi:Flp pilus assembly protein protease CpaA